MTLNCGKNMYMMFKSEHPLPLKKNKSMIINGYSVYFKKKKKKINKL